MTNKEHENEDAPPMEALSRLARTYAARPTKEKPTTPVGSGEMVGMNGYHLRVTRISVLPEGEPIFSERCTNVEINDEAGGEYVRVTQQSVCPDVKAQSIAIDPFEWPAIKAAIEQMMPTANGDSSAVAD